MPGRLIMNHSGANARDGENRKRDRDGKLINGDRTPRMDGGAVNGAGSMNGATAPGAASGALTAERLEELPPELVHLSEEFYHPLSKLYQRAAQECFNDLNVVLNSMGNMQGQQQSNGVNGMNGHANNAIDPETIKQKKLLLLKFAMDNRTKFIKLLVLTDWGRNSAKAISKVIDIYQWAVQQTTATDMADGQLDMMKHHIYQLSERNPDIRTALEVLSKGKAEWIPDMGFIPPEPMTAEETVKLLRYMDTSLAIRLKVHEDLPRHLKKWRIASGRVTFTIDNEFEMDLMAFSEDTSDQWLFIDMRLLFSPAPEIPTNSHFAAYLKPQMDSILKQSGLSGCFDFLHNLVLTHKIGVLRSQADKLAQAAWAGSIRVTLVHRQLVVQYWPDRPGKKSWIEIGISTNKPKDGKISWRGPPVSSLTVRWFRRGVEVKDVDLKFDFTNLSMERMLKRVIALHVKGFLRATRDGLPAHMKQTIQALISETEPSDCALHVFLGRAGLKTTLTVESVTGKCVLLPATPMSARAEGTINNLPNGLTPGTVITQLLAQTLQGLIQRHTMMLGWQSLPKHALRGDVIKNATKLDVLQSSLYWPSGWTKNWALAAVIDPSGETWWIVKLGGRATTIEHVEQLKMETTGPSAPITRATLGSVERLAVQQLAFSVTRHECQRLNLPNQVTVEVAVPPSSHSSSDSLTASPKTLRGWVLNLRTSDLLSTKAGDAPWLDPLIRVTSQGFKADYRNLSHIASGTMVKSVAADMHKLMSASPQKNFTFSENGNFSILLVTPFGAPIIDELRARLRDVDRLRSFATILEKRKMKLKSSSLQQVTFQYGQHDTATVNFAKENDIEISFNSSNPHHRIAKFLTLIINEKSPFNNAGTESSGLDQFCQTLVYTRPLFTTLSELEKSKPGNVENPQIFAHAVGHYRLSYANPLCSFDIKLKRKDDRVHWIIEPHKDAPRIETLKVALHEFFRRQEVAAGWRGVHSGVLAEIDAIGAALKGLHETVLSCEMEGGYRPPPPVVKAQRKEEKDEDVNVMGGAPVGVGTPKMVGPPMMMANGAQVQPPPNMPMNINMNGQGQGQNNNGARGPQSNSQIPLNQRRNFQHPLNGNGRQGQANGTSRQDVIELD